MDKKDIYEHLAKIYLDTNPSKASKKAPVPFLKKKKYYLLASVPAAIGIFVFLLLVSFRAYPVMPGSTSLVVAADTIRMSFNLAMAKKQAYELDLKNLNLGGYKSIVFSLRNPNYNDTLSFRVELSNAFKERAEVYVQEIGTRWKEYRVDLDDFSGISDWSEMTRLAFVIEEWNTRDNKGIVFIDDVRFLK